MICSALSSSSAYVPDVSSSMYTPVLVGRRSPLRLVPVIHRDFEDVIMLCLPTGKDRISIVRGKRCDVGFESVHHRTDVLALDAHLAGQAAQLRDDVELADWMLENAGVATVPGSAFGAPGHLRLSFATSLEQLQECVARIERALLIRQVVVAGEHVLVPPAHDLPRTVPLAPLDAARLAPLAGVRATVPAAATTTMPACQACITAWFIGSSQ